MCNVPSKVTVGIQYFPNQGFPFPLFLVISTTVFPEETQIHLSHLILSIHRFEQERLRYPTRVIAYLY